MRSLGLRLASGVSRAARLRSTCAPGRRILARCIHERKPLPYAIEEGMGNFLPPETLKMVAVDYQQGLLDRLNDQVRGTVLEGKSVVQTVVEAARDPKAVLEFNYACEALNNSFFLECLKPPPSDAPSHDKELNKSSLQARIRVDFGSVDQLKSNFSAAVLGMFSSGWVWLVCDKRGNLAVYPTFGVGTLLVRSRSALYGYSSVVGELIAPSLSQMRANTPTASPDSSGASAPSSPASGLSSSPPPLHPPGQSRAFSTVPGQVGQEYTPRPAGLFSNLSHAEDTIMPKRSQIGEFIYPLFCVSVHEHAWVSAGYGVWGKEEYMKRFWSVLDWGRVGQAYEKFISSAPPR
ncbi:uncharacterized protein FIBRA_06179 [Fibroporia radiculosa]|uniref:Manganese/iron superoxide dismutase C-terminal domain-containing protein n=1 Tax=Fibroporia radiculosa TaxID=599839 RepID=J4HYQ0_9APHY|nr:uncharacterized protein FIBRA_06179 [Fibroporia radiculosa]CCM04022.1 predicted protein [Fibroporia radiculosa]